MKRKLFFPAVSKTFNFFLLIFFVLLFLVNFNLNAHHLKIEIRGYDPLKNDGHLVILGYEFKELFKSEENFLFRYQVPINSFNGNIHLIGVEDKNVGILVFQDTDQNLNISRDFQGTIIEKYGFSLNPKKEFIQVEYEDVVFNMNSIEEDKPLIININ